MNGNFFKLHLKIVSISEKLQPFQRNVVLSSKTTNQKINKIQNEDIQDIFIFNEAANDDERRC